MSEHPFGPKHEGCRREFTQLSRAWYGESNLRPARPALVDAIVVGPHHQEGGTTGEFGIRWYDLDGQRTTPRPEAFNDAWDALWQFKDVLEKMAAIDDEHITPDEFCERLLSCGVEDATPVENTEEAGT